MDHSRDHRYRSLDLSLRSPLFLFSVGCSGGGRGRLGIEDSGFEEGFVMQFEREFQFLGFIWKFIWEWLHKLWNLG